MDNAYLLETPRLGILISHRADGSALGVPVWFDWDGVLVRCFAAKDSGKIARLARDPRASLLVTNSVGEMEAWLAFDGRVEVREDGGLELAEKLATRYWDLTDAANLAKLAQWRAHPEAFVLLVLTPEKIRAGH